MQDALGKPAADAIDWSEPRLVCIAADFTKYDGHAVQQINRNIDCIQAAYEGRAPGSNAQWAWVRAAHKRRATDFDRPMHQ